MNLKQNFVSKDNQSVMLLEKGRFSCGCGKWHTINMKYFTIKDFHLRTSLINIVFLILEDELLPSRRMHTIIYMTHALDLMDMAYIFICMHCISAGMFQIKHLAYSSPAYSPLNIPSLNIPPLEKISERGSPGIILDWISLN